MKLLLFAFLFSPLFVLANGGPVDWSMFRKTGNIRLMQKADVDLLEEDLSIKVEGDFSIIKVKYLLKNKGKNQRIQYGFPVDAYDAWWFYGDPPDQAFGIHNDPLIYFKVKQGDKNLKVNQWVVDSVYTAQSVNLKEGMYGQGNRKFSILRKWSVVSLSFEKGETKTLEIEYKIKNTLRDKIPGFSRIFHFTDRHFTYHLTPSGRWGDGLVGKFKLSINIQDVMEKKGTFKINGIENLKEKESGIYVFEQTNYDLKKKDRLHIHYDYRYILKADFIDRRVLSRNQILSIKSSNPQNLEYLIDNNPNTVWKGQEGDWIEVKIKAGTDGYQGANSIMFLNGDYSSYASFLKNPFAKNLKVNFNDTLIYRTKPWLGEESPTTIHFKNHKYVSVKNELKKGFSEVLVEEVSLPFRVGRLSEVNKIRIQILKGSKNGKVCISDLFFLGPDRKRKVYRDEIKIKED